MEELKAFKDAYNATRLALQGGPGSSMLDGTEALVERKGKRRGSTAEGVGVVMVSSRQQAGSSSPKKGKGKSVGSAKAKSAGSAEKRSSALFGGTDFMFGSSVGRWGGRLSLSLSSALSLSAGRFASLQAKPGRCGTTNRPIVPRLISNPKARASAEELDQLKNEVEELQEELQDRDQRLIQQQSDKSASTSKLGGKPNHVCVRDSTHALLLPAPPQDTSLSS